MRYLLIFIRATSLQGQSNCQPASPACAPGRETLTIGNLFSPILDHPNPKPIHSRSQSLHPELYDAQFGFFPIVVFTPVSRRADPRRSFSSEAYSLYPMNPRIQRIKATERSVVRQNWASHDFVWSGIFVQVDTTTVVNTNLRVLQNVHPAFR
jgi:hypothetical protein